MSMKQIFRTLVLWNFHELVHVEVPEEPLASGAACEQFTVHDLDDLAAEFEEDD